MHQNMHSPRQVVHNSMPGENWTNDAEARDMPNHSLENGGNNKDTFSNSHIYSLTTKTPTTTTPADTATSHVAWLRWTVCGTLLITITFGLLYLCREYISQTLFWLEHTERWLSFLVFACLFLLVSFVIAWGYVVLNIAAGYLYGFCLGLGVVSVCAALGILTSHVITRSCCKGFVQRRVAGAGLKALLKVVEGERGFRVIALARLTPIPFGLQNGLFAVSRHIYICALVFLL